MAKTSDKVVLAYVHPTDVTIGFHKSVQDLMLADINGNRRLFNGGGIINSYSSANVSNSRNGLVKKFLNESKAEWLFMVDTDMVFGPTALEGLLASADARPDSKKFAPIVGGLCYGVADGALFPTLYGLVEKDGGGVQTIRFDTMPENSMFQVAATGAAFLLVHRTVLEKIRDENFNTVYPWFQETHLGDSPCGEDVTFCFRAGKLGFPIWVDTGIHVGHQKTFIATHELYTKQVGNPYGVVDQEAG